MARTHATLFRVATALTGDADEAADVTQETYVRAWSRWGELRDASATLPWLCSIARHVAHDRRRSWWSRVTERIGRQAMSAPDDPARHPAVALEAEEDARSVRRALRTLPEKQRVVVALREIEGMTHDDIAAALGIPIGTVESRLHRGRALLARKLRAARSREERS